MPAAGVAVDVCCAAMLPKSRSTLCRDNRVHASLPLQSSLLMCRGLSAAAAAACRESPFADSVEAYLAPVQ